MLSTAGAEHIITMDLHASQIQVLMHSCLRNVLDKYKTFLHCALVVSYLSFENVFSKYVCLVTGRPSGRWKMCL